MSKFVCMCVSCSPFGGIQLSQSSILHHVTTMLQNGYSAESYPWLQQFSTKTEKATNVSDKNIFITYIYI